MQRAENCKSAGWHWFSVLPLLLLYVGCIESAPRTVPSGGESREVGADAVSTNKTGDSLPPQASAERPSANNTAPRLSATLSKGANAIPREALFVDWPKPEWVLMILSLIHI